MSDTNPDPRCPKCGEPIGQTATYCMHCSADLTDERESDDSGMPSWEGADDTAPDKGSSTASTVADGASGVADAAGIGTEDGQILDPDGFVDNTLTVIVGIVGGIVVGFVGTGVLATTTGSGWALPFGFVVWLGSTAYLVRRRTVQGAISKTGYAVALVILLTPLISLSPLFDASLQQRGETLLGGLVVVAFPAGIAAVIGYVAGRFVPEDEGGSDG